MLALLLWQALWFKLWGDGTTGMGEIVPIADAAGLAQDVIKMLKDRGAYFKPRSEIMQMFELAHAVDACESLFEAKRS